MAKQLNVNLAFTADTSQAKAQIQSLQTQLKAITSLNPTTAFGGTLTKQIQEASMAATQLQVHLKNATNVNTGTLDFTKLNQSLQKSQTNLSSYANKLLAIGPQGQQAFMSLAQAVASAEIPIRRSTGMLAEMGTVLKNTARWQISSSILHGFIGSIQSAYGYAQDLNESLNNIRIVTGQNIDQMAKFAENANKAAKALSTTTTAYTNAALIYYQQGDTDQQVLEKTDVTVKMANVTGQDATTVSDQLTAIWNNFNKAGDVAYEHYADILTALGAETASSTDEIAGGLEKFAAVAETIGLSYEYATAALTTITAKTRQSEDVVGTALKTIFARIQGLNLGETLDDGTTLNKYSEALQKVGINIFDQAGELKQMDAILDEMGSKWDTLSKAQQVALAQSVAGVRQYNQLISLMDNWDYMQENLQTAYNATGALDRQAEIYAESWDAAEKRVKAAAQGIYQSLLNDEFFIDLNNLFADLLEGLDGFIDKIGGVKSVLLMLGAIVTKVFSTQIANGLSQAATSMSLMTERGREKVRAQQADFVNESANIMAKQANEGLVSSAAKEQAESYKQQLELQSKLITNAGRLSEEEMQTAQILMDQVKARQEAEIEARKMANVAQTESGNKKINLFAKAAADQTGDQPVKFSDLQTNAIAPLNQAVDTKVRLSNLSSQFNALPEGASIDEVKKKLQDLKNEAKNNTDLEKYLDELIAEANTGTKSIEGLKNKLEELNVAAVADVETKKSNAQEKLNEGTNSNPVTNKDMDDYVMAQEKTVQANLNVENSEKAKKLAIQQTQEKIDQAIGAQKRWSDIVTQSANVFMNFGMGLSMISNMIDQLKSPDVSGWDKFLTVLTTIGMVIPSMVSTWGTLKSLISKETAAKAANTFATIAQTQAQKKLNETSNDYLGISGKSIKQYSKETKERIKNAFSKKKGSIKDRFSSMRDNWNTNSLNTFLADDNSGWKKLNNGKISVNGEEKTLADATQLAGKNSMAAMGKMAGGLALIAAAVALVGFTIKGVSDHYKKEEKAVENAAKAQQMLADRYEEVRNKQQEFNDTVSGYESGIEGLKGLTKGTIEYQKALMETNSQAMELINNNAELAGKYSINEDGVITFDEGALEDLQKEQLKEAAHAQAMSLLGQQATLAAESEKAKTDFSRDMDSGSDDGLGVGNAAAAGGIGALAGAGAAVGGAMLAGATIGSAIPVIGTAIGAAVGLAAGGITAAVMGAESKKEEEAINKLTEYVAENGNSLFAEDKDEFARILKTELNINDTSLINSLYDNRASLDKLTEVETKRLQQENAAFKNALTTKLQAENEEFQNLELGKDYIANMGVQYQEENRERVTKEVDEMFKGSNDDFWADFLREVYGQENVDEGNTEGESYRVRNLGGKGVTLQHKNAEGVWETVGEKNGLSEEAAKEQLINAKLLNEAMQYLDFEGLQEKTEQLKAAGLDVEKNTAVMDRILSDFANPDTNGDIDLSEFDPEEIFSINAAAIDGEMGKKVRAAINSYSQGLSKVKKDVYNSSWYQDLTEEEKELVWSIDIDKQESLEAVQTTFQHMQNWLESNRLIASIQFEEDILSKYKEGDLEGFKSAIEEYYKGQGMDEAKAKEQAEKDYSEIFSTTDRDEQVKKIQDKYGTDKALSASAATISSAAYGSQEVYDDTVERYEQRVEQEGEINALVEENKEENKNLLDRKKAARGRLGYDQFYSRLKSSTDSIYKDAANAVLTEFFDQNTFDFSEWSKYSGKTKEDGEKLYQDSILALMNPEADFGTTQNAVQQLQLFESFSPGTISKELNEFLEFVQFNGKPTEDSSAQMIREYEDLFYAAFVDPHIEEAYKYDTGGYGNSNTIAESENKIKKNNIKIAELRREKDETLPTETDVENAQKEVTEQAENLYLLQQSMFSAAEAVGLSQQQLIAYGQAVAESTDISSIYKDEKVRETVAQDLAINLFGMKKGIEGLTSSWMDFDEAFSNTEAPISNLIELLPDLQQALAKTLGVELDLLEQFGYDFYQKHWVLIENIKNGVEGAVEKFQGVLFQEGIKESGINLPPDAIKNIGTFVTQQSDYAAGEKISAELAKQFENFTNTNLSDQDVEKVAQLFSLLGWVLEYDAKTKEINWQNSYYEGANKQVASNLETLKQDLEDFEPAKLEDAIERYKEINDQIDDITDAYDKASKAADRLYGAERISALQEANNLLEKEIDLTKQKKVEAEQYLKTDRDALQKLGLGVRIDDSGNVINATDIMRELVYQLNAAGDSNHDGKTSEDEKKAQEEVQKKIDKFKEALSLYDETRELIVDLDKEATDKFYQWQDNNYQMLTESLENATKPLERQLKQIDFYIKRLGDSFYHTAARGQELQKKFQITQEKISAYSNSLTELLASRSDIGEKNFAEGIEQFIDNNLSEMENLLSYKEEMESFYEDAFSSANEEIEKYTDKIEHLNSVLEHYNDLLALFGEEENFEAQRTILEAQESIANNSYEIAKNTYTLMAEQEVALKRQLDQAIAAGADEETIELYTKYWEDAAEATREAENKMLESAKEWAEAIKATFENTLKELNKELEKTLSGGTSFDDLSTQMERRQSLQEEYLTTTNKIYETNKLINSAQQEIDKTSNTVAKNRMKNFIRETEQLQKQGELSQFELDIQQAKYDLLLAEIALEEAQNAKSTVTLQRDSEGNFGYVYTADSSAVAQAQQEFDNAQNALYNIGLEGANKYTESYTQTLQEMYDKLAEIQQQRLDGYFQTEQEYEDAILAAKEFYYKKLEQYSSLYATAVTVDSNIVADAWSTDFANMVYDTENWKDAVNDYLEEIKGAFGDFEDQMSVIRNETVGEDLDALAEKTNNITKKSKDLTTEITKSGGLLDSLGKVFLKAQEVAEAFGSIAAQIEDTINRLQGLNGTAEESLDQDSSSSNGNLNNSYSGSSSGNGGSSGGNSGAGGGSSGRFGAGRDASYNDDIEKIYDKIFHGTYGNGTDVRLKHAQSEGFTPDEYWMAQEIIDWVFGRGYSYSEARNTLGFDTGGYTGNWDGPYGKLALLHQKELVLNAEDTKNLLASVEVLDSILKTMDLYNIQMASLTSPSVETGHSDTLEQNVHIEANFPNATDHSEIEQAFDNLINLASQYANRK